MIELKNINKSYGKLHVLKDVSLTISKKEILCIEGPSGAGKTTLLKIIGKLENMDSGKIIFNGEELNNLKGSKLCDFRNQKIGFVFQFHHLMPEFTVFENICMPSFINKNIKESENYALKLMEALNIQNKKNDFPSNLSGGEQQRVAIARALINKPQLVLADEPSGNLDIEQANSMHKLFSEIRNDFNQTFAIVTHNKDLSALCDRTITLKDGIIS
tara:strand:- start:25 stop:672 length:648 start_codon:yes stop_codon:yes gene_type:complete